MTTQEAFNRVVYCQDVLDIEADYFIREGVKYRVDYDMTYNANLDNKGTPFVIGCNVLELTQCLKVKTFLVKEWLKS